MKRKSTDVSYLVSTDEEDVQVEKKILKQKSHQVFTGLLLSMHMC